MRSTRAAPSVASAPSVYSVLRFCVVFRFWLGLGLGDMIEVFPRVSTSTFLNLVSTVDLIFVIVTISVDHVLVCSATVFVLFAGCLCSD